MQGRRVLDLLFHLQPLLDANVAAMLLTPMVRIFPLLPVRLRCVPACKNVTAPKERIQPSPNSGPENFPTALYATARTTAGGPAPGGEMSVTYTLQNVDAGALVLVILHFAEIQEGEEKVQA